MKRLEERLDCRLFERVGRRLVLAPAGERLLAQAQRLVTQSEELLSSMRQPAFEGEVRFGVPYDIIGSFVPAILRRFAKAQPRVRVSLVCEDSRVVRQQLRSGGVDLALTTETDCGRGAETLRTDRLVWVGVPGSNRPSQDPAAGVARRADLRVPSGGDQGRWARRGANWRAVCEVSQLEPVHATIEAGLAVAPLLRPSVPNASRSWAGNARLPAPPRVPASTSMCRPAQARLARSRLSTSARHAQRDAKFVTASAAARSQADPVQHLRIAGL